MVFRALTDIDDDVSMGAVDELIVRAYGTSSRRKRVERFMRLQRGGWVVAEEPTSKGNQVVGCGGCIAYPGGGFGWIGLIAVDPSMHGQGLGRIVTQWLIDHLAILGCSPVLDGSASGAPLYEKIGFVDHGVSTLMMAPDRPQTSQFPTSVIRLTGSDLDSLYAYDQRVFGADRSKLLRDINQENPGRTFAIKSETGSLNGYVMAQDTSIGPLVADHPRGFDDLLAAALSVEFPSAPTVCVPPGTLYREQWVAAGFREMRSLRRQHLGIGSLPGSHQLVAAQASFGEG